MNASKYFRRKNADKLMTCSMIAKEIILTLGILTFFLCSCNNAQSQQKINVDQAIVALQEAYKNGDWDKIITIGDKLIGDDDPYNISIIYAEGLAAKGNVEKTINVLDKKIIKTPDDYFLYNTKGNVYYVAGQLDSAFQYYNKVIEMRPGYARAYIRNGEICELVGDNEWAIKYYLQALKLFASNNFKDEVLLYSNKILELDPINEEAKAYLIEFEKN